VWPLPQHTGFTFSREQFQGALQIILDLSVTKALLLKRKRNELVAVLALDDAHLSLPFFKPELMGFAILGTTTVRLKPLTSRFVLPSLSSVPRRNLMIAGSSQPPVPPAAPPSSPPDPTAKAQQSPLFMAIINELNTNLDQLQKRQKILAEMEKVLTARYGAANRVASYMFRFGHAHAAMGTDDLPSFEAALNSISGAEQLNLIMHSPGGDGTVVEKMVDMCRSHLSGNNRQFRVIVPNIAKSAATILALGADKILMGYCSELGPIDPQVQIVVSGAMQWISALAFVESRDRLMTEIADATKKKKPTAGLLQQLASLNIPFTVEMENWIDFAGKTAETLLFKYMLTPSLPKTAARKKKAQDIAQKLLSKQLFPVHGQFIDGATAKQLGLDVDVLPQNDRLWELIWEYYIRSEVQMNIPLQPGVIKTKLFESTQTSLVAQAPGN
jgi:hypothetical protein